MYIVERILETVKFKICSESNISFLVATLWVAENKEGEQENRKGKHSKRRKQKRED